MRKLIQLALLTSIALHVKAQNSFMIGSKVLPSSNSFYFQKDSYYKCDYGFEAGCVELFFSKDGSINMFVIKVYSGIWKNRIRGNLLIYLEDNSLITCTDKGKFDIVDNYATTIYYLTNSEIAKIKNSNISRIRFSFGSSPYMLEDKSLPNQYFNAMGIGYDRFKGGKTDVSGIVTDFFK